MRIKKLGFLMFTFVVAMMFIQVVYADTTSEQHTHCFCGKTDCNNGKQHSILASKEITYTPFDGTTQIAYDSNRCAYIYLTKDVTLSGSIGATNATLYICLNGHKLSSSNLSSPIINNLKNLVICDCVGNGEIGNRGTSESPAIQAINVATNCNAYLYGGKIANNITNCSGAGIFVAKSANLYMYGGTVANNKSTQDGGGIATETGTINVLGGTIDSNIASNGGGLSVAKKGKINISGGSVSNNVASGFGGGIYAYGSTSSNRVTANISGNTEIIGNASGGNGGGIGTKDYATVNVSGGTIKENKGANGGGILVYSKWCYFTLSNCSIIGNTTTGKGGAIYQNGSLDVSNKVLIYGNKYVSSDGKTTSNNNVQLILSKPITCGAGGLSSNSMIYVTLDNKSSAITGAFNEDCSSQIISDDKNYFVAYDKTSKTHSLTQHTHCICGKTDCDDTSVGHSILEKKGVVYKAFDGTDEIEYDANNCAYIALPRDVTLSNSLGKEGATLYICLNGHKLSSSNLEAPIINNLKNLVICDCVGTGEIGNRGTDDSPAVQAINIANDCNVYVYGGSIANNITNSNGAGVLLGDSASFYMYGGSVKNNKTTQNGGGISVQPSSSGGVYLYNGEISDNSAVNGGGIYFDNGYNFNMSGGEIKNNSSTESGAGISILGNMNAYISGGSIYENVCTSNGGGIFATDYNAKVIITGGTITKNTAMWGGGIYLFNAAQMTMSDSAVISENTANSNGGGVFLNQSANVSGVGIVKPTLTMTGGNIEGNTATGNGGGICEARGSVVDISGGTVKNNKSSHGAGIFIGDVSNATFSDGVITGNTATGYGGGVYACESRETTFTMTGGNINENTAIYGGAISLEKATVNITGGYIDSNVATEGGGCHVRNGGKLNITDGNLMNNTATEAAGVYAYGNNEYNRVIVTISGNTEIMNNIATGNGGGIGTKDYVTINLSDGMVRDNEALNGGGVYMDNTNTNVNLSNCFIGGNRVRGNGGGIYHNGNLDVSEIVQIYGNKCMTSDGETASNNNVYLTSGKTITNNSGELGNDSYIYVTVIDKENAFTGVFNEDLSDRIVSDDKAYVVVYDATSKTYGLAQAVCITLDPKNEYEGPVECYIQKGTVFSKPEYEPMYDNYRFIGWYKDGVRYDFSKVVNEDIILTAEWIKSDSAPVELTKEGYAVSGVTCSGTLYIASYGEKELISAKAVPVNGDVKGTFADIGLDTTGAISISAYLWENNMAPLSETVSVKLNS